MGSDTFYLTIAGVGETRFDGESVSITLPGTEGMFEILPHHEALVTTLAKGIIRTRDATGEVQQFEIENGVVECANNRVVVLL